MKLGKGKSKKEIEGEIAARVAAAEAVGEQKLAEERELHAADLDVAYALANDLSEAVSTAMQAGAIAATGMQILEASESEINRLRAHVENIQTLAGKQRDRIGALTATLSALRYAGNDPQIGRVLDAVDGFVDLVRQGSDLLLGEADRASVEPDYDLPNFDTLANLASFGGFDSLADEIEDDEPVTVEIDLGDLGLSTDAERSFFDR